MWQRQIHHVERSWLRVTKSRMASGCGSWMTTKS